MSNTQVEEELILGDRVQHSFTVTGKFGIIRGIRTEPPYTHKVVWDYGGEDWYKRDALTFISRESHKGTETPCDCVFNDGACELHEDKGTGEGETYQTHIHFIRTLSNGKDVWGVRIGYQAQTVYSDIADSEEQAKEKLARELEVLRATHLTNKESQHHE